MEDFCSMNKKYIIAVISILSFLASCSSGGNFYIRNQTAKTIELVLNDKIEVIPSGKISKKHRRTQVFPNMIVSIAQCRYVYNSDDFNKPIPIEDQKKVDRKELPALVELAVNEDGLIRLFQIKRKDKSRILELKPGGHPIRPRNTCKSG